MPNLHVTFSFGRHGDAADARELAAHLAQVEPDLFVQETADLPERQRLSMIRETNTALEKERALGAHRGRRPPRWPHKVRHARVSHWRR